MNAGVLIRLRHELTFLQRYLSRSLVFNVLDYLFSRLILSSLTDDRDVWSVLRLYVDLHRTNTFV